MSISSQISRISKNVSDSLDAVAAKGVTVPSGSTSDDLPDLIAQITSGGTAAISVVDTLDTAGGTIRTITALDISDTTATASDVASGKYFYTANGTKTAGTGSAGSDAPTITMTYSSDPNPVITCDKTYAECYAYYTDSSNNNHSCNVVVVYGGETHTYGCSAIASDNSIRVYGGDGSPEGNPAVLITYTSSGFSVQEAPVFPYFTITYDSTWTTIQSVECNKTYAECISVMQQNAWVALARRYNGSNYGLMVPASVWYNNSTETISFYLEIGTEGVADIKIEYTSSGTLTATANPIPFRTSSNLTASTLTVTAPSGYYASNATKTLTDANLTAGNIKNGVSIFGVTGTYEGSGSGIDCPTFTVTMDSGWSTIQSVTCDKTYSECYNYHDNGTLEAVLAITNGTNGAFYGATGSYASNKMTYYADLQGIGVAIMKIEYASSGTITGTMMPIQFNDSTDMNVSGATVTAPAGYYQSAASATVASGSVTAPATISGTSATVSTGTNTLTLTKSVSVTPTVSTAGYVSSGTAGNSSVSLTASVTTKAAATITPTTSNQTIASGTYLTGTQTISGDTNLVAGNIISGKSIFGVSGSVVIQHYYTGTGTPSSSLGENGDIYLKTT